MIISVIIINYNTFQLTCNCVASVIQHTKGVHYEIILVDNNSTECNPDLFLEKFTDIVLVKNTENAGFAKGNNAGIKHAKGNIILLLNSDTYLQEDSISKSAIVLQQTANTGVLGIRMIYPDGKIQRTARRFRTVTWELLDLLRLIPLLMPYKKRARLMLGKYFNADFDIECDWLNGAYFMFPSLILQKLPGNKLDERFFMYGEDQLWCYQIKRLGFRCFFYCGTTIVHIEKGSTNKEKQLQLIKKAIPKELEIMREVNKNKISYYFSSTIYLCKEHSRYFIKLIAFKISGKIMR